MSDWRFVACLPATTGVQALGELTDARDRQVTWRLGEPADASFTLDGRHELARLVDELTVDLAVYHGSDLVFRGRVGATQDDLDGDRHDVTYTAVDYSGLLARRHLYPPRSPWTFTNAAQGSIVRQLIDYAQANLGSPLAIQAGAVTVPDTPVTRQIEFPTAKPVAEAIDDLAVLEDGFDWWIGPDLVARLAHPQRGAERDLVAEYGSTVTAVRRSFDPARYGNVVIATGGRDTAVGSATAPDIAARPEGRLELVESNSDLARPALLASWSRQVLAASSTVTPAYSCTMTPGVWAPGDLWLGDVTWLVIRSGRLDVARPERVAQIDVQVGDDGSEDVSLTFGTVPHLLARRLRATERRLNRLERLGAP